jgi:gliding motility-associated-like protein
VNVTVNSITAGYIQSADSGYYPLPVVFTDTSKVNPVSWSWTFGDGGTSNNQNPNNTYTASGIYTVTLTVTNAAGCTNTKTSVITISDTPSWITIPTVFTPNGDGTNDLLLISSAGIVEFHADFFDRWGVLLASINNVNEAWDGRTVGGQPLSSGTYYYLVTAKGDDKRVFNLKGFVELIH